jgi:hypothetical protein
MLSQFYKGFIDEGKVAFIYPTVGVLLLKEKGDSSIIKKLFL